MFEHDWEINILECINYKNSITKWKQRENNIFKSNDEVQKRQEN